MMALSCSSCERRFTSVEAFELHATGFAAPVPNAPRRCRTAEEMRKLGLHRVAGALWAVDGPRVRRFKIATR
jgi:hypothetical protein